MMIDAMKPAGVENPCGGDSDQNRTVMLVDFPADDLVLIPPRKPLGQRTEYRYKTAA